eukprot:2910645-Amphidinium_carterae.1
MAYFFFAPVADCSSRWCLSREPSAHCGHVTSWPCFHRAKRLEQGYGWHDSAAGYRTSVSETAR